MPPGATTGKIQVVARNGTAVSSTNFTVTAQPAPTVTGLSAASGPVGSTLVINGTNFVGDVGVWFNGVAASPSTSSPTVLTVTVPVGAISGPVQLTTAGVTATSDGSFPLSASAAPTLTGFTPSSGPRGRASPSPARPRPHRRFVQRRANHQLQRYVADADHRIQRAGSRLTGPITVVARRRATSSSTSPSPQRAPPSLALRLAPAGRGRSDHQRHELDGRQCRNVGGVEVIRPKSLSIRHKITVKVPVGVAGGPIAVATPGTALSSASFAATVAPADHHRLHAAAGGRTAPQW